MNETLHDLVTLLLRSIPTIIIFLVVWAGYRFIVHAPLMRVLRERRERTEGAVAKARADIAAAEAKTAEYEERFREAKIAVFKFQEKRRQTALQARGEVLERARQQAQSRVTQAKAEMDQDIEVAKRGLQSDAERLANEVIATILRPSGVPSPVGGSR